MSDRGVFLTAFLTLFLVAAGAFAIPELFIYQMLSSTIFVVIAVMVFFGEDKFPYMLGMIAPVLWLVFSMLSGGFFRQFGVLAKFLSVRTTDSVDTPLHAFAFISAIALFILCA